ncbi:hypothetical protein [Agromyces aerolatus]|uniref:hypothetical protein n=1 Tax=Agromyces sp. LY-1074 TaxID=3074080 RepID=UPI002856AC8E|nr:MULTISPECIES: hypothetical protein [unclassified Agromyces]MDR5699621.1 hypothetical protein [Agromyces sp. LY-1074]MDR5705917.1 hypothetical protein [Agromyces sp. LY-1358]
MPTRLFLQRARDAARRLGRSASCALLAGALSIGIVHGSTGTALAQAVENLRDERRKSVETPVRIDAGNGIVLHVGGSLGGAQVESGHAGITWDSTVANVTRAAFFGPGWTWGTPYLQREAGLDRLYVPGHGLHQVDPESPSGVSGDLTDIVFTREAGTVPARGDGQVPARPYIATLRSLATGAVDYFDDAGNVITTIDETGDRTDRAFERFWDGPEADHLRSVTDPAGQVTTIDYESYTRVTHPDGAEARFELIDWGYPPAVGRIYAMNAAGDEGFIDAFAYRIEPDATPLLAVVEYSNTTGTTSGLAHIAWSDAQSGVVDRVSLGDRVVYERPDARP